MRVRYKGYEAMQSDYNHHVMVVKDGQAVMHINCIKEMSAKELGGEIERCIEMRDDRSCGWGVISPSGVAADKMSPHHRAEGAVPLPPLYGGGATLPRTTVL